ncbi:MAG: hypothetical protein ACE5J3_09590 [Methanosarcinales archaeon]
MWIEEEREIPTCPHCGYKGYRHCHTKRWYMKNWKINPERLSIKPEYVENPYNPEFAPMKVYPECLVKEQHKLHPELTIKPRTEKQKEAIKKLVEINRRRRIEKERLEEVERNMREKKLEKEQALKKLRRKAKAKREKKFKSANAASLNKYTH